MDLPQLISIIRSTMHRSHRSHEIIFGINRNMSLAGIGVWLDGNNGISVDCMSSRGFSGVTLSRVSSSLSQSMRRYIDYDLIVIEYGINAMSEAQTDYSAYSKLMIKSIGHIKECYPNADIIIMGVGDRGVKTRHRHNNDAHYLQHDRRST